MTRGRLAAPLGQRGLALLIILVAFALRLLRLSWQPLWWDEGYSIYFATEPLSRLMWLTAQDIHPPLYYILLRFWILVLGTARPESARMLSLCLALPAIPLAGLLARRLLPQHRVVAILVMAFLALNPMHIFYSQEVRMYGLATTTALASTLLFWTWLQTVLSDQDVKMCGIVYVLVAAALFHIHYYGLLIIAAHCIYAAARLHQTRRIHWRFLWAPLSLLLACLPWSIFTWSYLAQYVGDKVASDQDIPLSLLAYLYSHVTAFTTGHLISSNTVMRWLNPVGLVGVILIAVAALATQFRRPNSIATIFSSAGRDQGILFFLVAIPFAIAYGINLWWPFFPQGGQRLLLIILPFVWLLISKELAQSVIPLRLRTLSGLLLLLTSLGGIATFFTLPRYPDHDYRPIITQVMQQSTPDDSILVIFPWQIGYWRAYSPRDQNGALLTPQPPPLDQQALKWNAQLAAQIDSDLTNGAVWFPAPLSFGSTLPGQIESFLKQQAANVVNKWFGESTRLTAWSSPQRLTPILVSLRSASQQVDVKGVGPRTAISANQVFYIKVAWSGAGSDVNTELVLRVVDQTNTIWATRTINLSSEFGVDTNDPTGFIERSFGLIIPPGVPPGAYIAQVALSTHAPGNNDESSTSPNADSGFVALAPLTITLPTVPVSIARLPIETSTPSARQFANIRLLGYSGISDQSILLAGTKVPAHLFLQVLENAPAIQDLQMRVVAADEQVVAQWQGWPLPSYPPSQWATGALVHVPAPFYLPATITGGTYTLRARFVDRSSAYSEWIALGAFQIRQRLAHFTRLEPAHILSQPAQIGTHAQLYGYDIVEEQGQLVVHLYWEVQASLIPPHHIFVHLLHKGARIGQADGVPQTDEGDAPSGSWFPGEFLRTRHTLGASALIVAAALEDVALEVGLYVPETEVRLPVAIGSLPIGDHVTIEVTQFD